MIRSKMEDTTRENLSENVLCRRLNFFWAYAYNVVQIPLAGGLFYPLTGWLLTPMHAAVAMTWIGFTFPFSLPSE